MRFLITGTAGFIGFHVAQRMLSEGHAVVGIDGITPYYDQSLKQRRHEILGGFPQFRANVFMLEDAARLAECVRSAAADVVIHLAAQAGVRYSAENPRAYLDSNIVGTFNLLEALKGAPCRHLIFGVHELGLRREPADSIRGNAANRSTRLALRRHEKSHRSAGVHSRLQRRAADNGHPPVHGLRSVGPTRHGDLQVHQEHHRRQPDRRLRLRKNDEGFHLCR